MVGRAAFRCSSSARGSRLEKKDRSPRQILACSSRFATCFPKARAPLPTMSAPAGHSSPSPVSPAATHAEHAENVAGQSATGFSARAHFLKGDIANVPARLEEARDPEGEHQQQVSRRTTFAAAGRRPLAAEAPGERRMQPLRRAGSASVRTAGRSTRRASTM